MVRLMERKLRETERENDGGLLRALRDVRRGRSRFTALGARATGGATTAGALSAVASPPPTEAVSMRA